MKKMEVTNLGTRSAGEIKNGSRQSRSSLSSEQQGQENRVSHKEHLSRSIDSVVPEAKRSTQNVTSEGALEAKDITTAGEMRDHQNGGSGSRNASARSHRSDEQNGGRQSRSSLKACHILLAPDSAVSELLTPCELHASCMICIPR